MLIDSHARDWLLTGGPGWWNLRLARGSPWRLDDQVDGEPVLDVMCPECFVVLHNFSGKNKADLIGLGVEFLRDRVFELRI